MKREAHKRKMVPFFCLTVYIATKSKIESRAHYAPKNPQGARAGADETRKLDILFKIQLLELYK